MIVEQSTPTTMPLTVDQAKDHLNVTHIHDDQLIGALISAATRHIEKHANVRLIRRSVRQYCDGWEDIRYADDSSYTRRRGIRLACGPASTTSGPTVSYVDTDGTTQTLSTSIWGMTATEPRVIYEHSSQSFPSLTVDPGNVYVTYDCGYGTTQREMPQTFVQASRLLIGHWYRNREAVEVGDVPRELSIGVEALLGERRELYR